MSSYDFLTIRQQVQGCGELVCGWTHAILVARINPLLGDDHIDCLRLAHLKRRLSVHLELDPRDGAVVLIDLVDGEAAHRPGCRRHEQQACQRKQR